MDTIIASIPMMIVRVLASLKSLSRSSFGLAVPIKSFAPSTEDTFTTAPIVDMEAAIAKIPIKNHGGYHMRESHIKTEYGTVYDWATEIDNAKRTLFFLHGLTANHTMFDSQIAHFKNTYNVIARDAPAHRKSRP